MQCLTNDEMEEYIMDDHLSKKQLVASHIATCLRCRTLYQTQLEEQTRWSQDLFEEVLPDSFTSNVMALIEHEEIELAAIENTFVTDTVAHRKSLFKKRRSGYWKVMIGIATLLIIMGSVLMYTVPTLAEKLRSLFGQGYVDTGLLRAQELGLVVHPNIKVKDKGYTIKIDEAVADPTRVIIALQLFGPDGKHNRDKLQLTGKNDIMIKDDQGEVVGDVYDMGYTSDFYYMVAFFPEPLQTDEITIEGHISQLDNKMKKIPLIEGDWNFDFTIDMKEANKKTTITPLNSSYTTPDGMTVRLKRLTRMIQGVRLEIDTELNKESLMRSPNELWKQQGLKFHFEDVQGDEILSVNTRKKFLHWKRDDTVPSSR
ncbi:hypothetical protein PMSD_16395 [Paenibacillus macquariensis subsp. defensor]|nr:hypothetical protein PMSD_16395 [Paenibacillus macquariensis subsp. defensor]